MTDSTPKNDAIDADQVPQDENKLIAERRQKLNAIREQGNAFPNDFRRDSLAADVHQQYEALEKEDLAEKNVTVSLAGRLMAKRIMGKASFVQLQDSSGRIQLYVARDELAAGNYPDFKHWDIGDIIGVTGALFKTKTGELSVRAAEIRLLTKSLRPLPEKYHGISDQEMKYRQRYVDLIVSEPTRNAFQIRSAAVRYIREYFFQQGFTEVETPMMQVIPGGATAKPFVTHHNALDLDMYLRIAPELYLKRLVVGGVEKVYEINRNFRNEGLSTRHNPEFTMLEFYWAYADYNDLMDMTEELLQGLCQTVLGTTTVSYQGEEYDFGSAFVRLPMKQAVLQYNPSLSAEDVESFETLKSYLVETLKVEINEGIGLGGLLTLVFEETVEHLLKNPTFITEYPTEVSPLSRRNDDNPDITDRFELFIGGREIANGFSELNDAEDQAERFQAQVDAKDAGDDEAMHYDADYIRALEYGLPPTAGEGIGIDRLVMLLCDAPSIRDVILFPHMRPEAGV
jgi:lysyl-tRNA synthetase class 2